MVAKNSDRERGGRRGSGVEGVGEVGGIEFGFEEEGIVTAIGVDGDVNVGDAGLFQIADEGGLFLGIEAVVFVDTEDEVVMVVFF